MIAIQSTPTASDTDVFVRARPRLLKVARRVLTNTADADDVVQDAWLRWQGTDRRAVRDPIAFLATTTTRLALNVGQSARARRETATEPQLLESFDAQTDPAVGVERRQALELALRTVMESLSPGERGVYLLREAFDYPYGRIADVLGLTEANARQLAARARRHVSCGPRRAVAAEEHRRLVDAFLLATDTGGLAELEQTLAAGIASPHVRVFAA